jgi:hypothetical protein
MSASLYRAAELLDDAVVRDGLADHWRKILLGRNGQVNESRGVGGDSKGVVVESPLHSLTRIGQFSMSEKSPWLRQQSQRSR